jgi:hypothetical protein
MRLRINLDDMTEAEDLCRRFLLGCTRLRWRYRISREKKANRYSSLERIVARIEIDPGTDGQVRLIGVFRRE